MDRLTRFPWGTLGLSTALTGAAVVAIVAFGAPPWILLLVAWGGAVLYAATSSWVDRRLGRR